MNELRSSQPDGIGRKSAGDASSVTPTDQHSRRPTGEIDASFFWSTACQCFHELLDALACDRLLHALGGSLETYQSSDQRVVSRVRRIRVFLLQQGVQSMLGFRQRRWHVEANAAQTRRADGNEQGRNGFNARGQVREPLLDEIAPGKCGINSTWTCGH